MANRWSFPKCSDGFPAVSGFQLAPSSSLPASFWLPGGVAPPERCKTWGSINGSPRPSKHGRWPRRSHHGRRVPLRMAQGASWARWTLVRKHSKSGPIGKKTRNKHAISYYKKSWLERATKRYMTMIKSSKDWLSKERYSSTIESSQVERWINNNSLKQQAEWECPENRSPIPRLKTIGSTSVYCFYKS